MLAIGSTVTAAGVVGERRDAGEPLAAVHPHPARAARGVEARVPQRERAVVVQLDPTEGLEHRVRAPTGTSNSST